MALLGAIPDRPRCTRGAHTQTKAGPILAHTIGSRPNDCDTGAHESIRHLCASITAEEHTYTHCCAPSVCNYIHAHTPRWCAPAAYMYRTPL
eukprot:3936452-Prymnesium_polylepis.1